MCSSAKKIGTVEKNYEEKRVEWKIKDFLSVIEGEPSIYESSTFLFAGASWHLQIELYDRMYLSLCNEVLREYSVEFTLGIREVNGSLKVLNKGILEGDEYTDDDDYEGLELTELRQQKSEFLPSDVLTVACTLKCIFTNPDPPNKLISFDTLSENFKDLFSNKDSCDVILRIMDKEFKAHRSVLIARSSVFAAMFRHPMSEQQTGIINIEDCDPDSFEEFLEFIYCGKLEKLSFCSALHLYVTSDKYNVRDLKEFCSGYLKENLGVENVCDAVILADKYDDEMLISSAQECFSENYDEVFETTDWECLLKNNYRLANKLLKTIPKRKKRKRK